MDISNQIPYSKALGMDIAELVRAARKAGYRGGRNLSDDPGWKPLFMDMYDRGYILPDPSGVNIRPVSARNVPVPSGSDDVWALAEDLAAEDAIACNGLALVYAQPGMGKDDLYLAVRAFDSYNAWARYHKHLKTFASMRIAAISDVMQIERNLFEEFPDGNEVFQPETGRSALVGRSIRRPEA
ncbi:hypothetical protein [Streptomyces sp. NPDC059166]|uniref:hypothetical protein n=1 Tax=Streptomyces sp. NPDC059166 TaxID=3346752 RepID=UPI0036835E9B